MNILVCGFYSQQNIGDNSYQIAFKKLFPQYNFTFTNTINNINCSQYNAIFVGGGDVLSDYLLNQLKSINLPKYAISISGNEKVNYNNLTFKHIFVRDFYSLKHMEKLNLPVKFIPDISFILSADKLEGSKILKKQFLEQEQYEKVIGIIINSYLYSDPERNCNASNSIFFNNFAYQLADIIDTTNASFIFIPFGTQCPWDDRIANGVVASKCKYWKKNTIIYERLCVQDTLNVISACDLIISSRLHSSIFSTIAEVPFIDVTHNHKNLWFLDTINKQNYSLSYKNFNISECKLLINQMLANKYAIQQELSFLRYQQIIKINEAINGTSICLSG